MSTATAKVPKSVKAMSANGDGKAVAAPAAQVKRGPTAGPTLDQFREYADSLKMLADGTRLRIGYELYHGERHVGGLCEVLGMSQPAVSHHLAMQRLAGVIRARREGKQNWYSLTDKGRAILAPIIAMIGQ